MSWTTFMDYWSEETLKVRAAQFFGYLATIFVLIYLGMLAFNVLLDFEIFIVGTFMVSIMLWAIFDSKYVRHVFEKLFGVTLTLFILFGIIFFVGVRTEILNIVSQINQYLLIVSFGLIIALPSRRLNAVELLGIGIEIVGIALLGLWIMLQWNSIVATTIVSYINTYVAIQNIFEASIIVILIGVTTYAIAQRSIPLTAFIISKAFLSLGLGLAIILFLLNFLNNAFGATLQNEIQLFGIMFIVGVVGAVGVWVFFGEKLSKITQLRDIAERSQEVVDAVEEVFAGLTVGDQIYYIDKDTPIVSTSNSRIILHEGTFAVPIMKDGYEVGIVAFGNGRYFFETKIKTFENGFDGDLTLIAKREKWNSIRAKEFWKVINPEDIMRYSSTTYADILNLAKKRLSEVTKWTAETERVSGTESKEAVNIELPFIKVQIDPFRRRQHVRVGPIVVTEEKGVQEVKFGPFKFVEAVDIERWARADFKGMIVDQTGESVYFAVSPKYITLKIGTMTLYSNRIRLRIVDENIYIKMSSDYTRITAGEFLLKLYRNSLKLVSGRVILKVDGKTGRVKYIDSYGRIKRIYDYDTANRIIQQMQDITLDLIRAIIERKSMDSLTDFLNYLDKNLF